MITTKVEDLGVRERLTRAQRFAADFLIPEQIIVEVITTRVEQRFATGDNGQWTDIKPETRQRRKGDRTAPPGTDLGDMRRAVTATREGVPNSLLRYDPDGVTLGVDTDGAAAFQNGTEDGSQPPRPFLTIEDEDLEIAMNRYGALLEQIVGG